MEFIHVGTHCSLPSCQQHDFLPFQCNLCKDKFCLDHRRYEDHNCRNIHLKKNQIPVCPLCDEPIPIKPTDDINIVVSRHIEQGCPKPPTTLYPSPKAPKCSFKLCKDNAITTCNMCHKIHCLNHRHDVSHQCSALHTRAALTSKSTLGVGPFRQAQPSRDVQLLKQELGKPKFTNIVIQPKKRSDNNAKIEFINSESNHVGNRNLDVGKRFFLRIFFSLDTYLQPVHMVFSRDWSVGRVLDFVAEFAKLPNSNNSLNVAEQHKLFLFNLQTGDKLPNSRTLYDLSKDCTLQSGDSIILIRGGIIETEKQVFAPMAVNVANSKCIKVC